MTFRHSGSAALAFVCAFGMAEAASAQQTSRPAASVTGANAQASIGAPNTPSAQRRPGGYYIEFRVGQIGAYGHSYVVYGRTDGAPNYADLHPMGNYAIMALGHVLPVPANTEWNPDVLKLPVASRYRRPLDSHQYQKLLAAIRQSATKQRYWNAVVNNCNHFLGELAEAVGLRVPAQFQLSYAFVPALRALNEGAEGANSRVVR